jgi:putative PIN family toxin of toxin-antitoxin system
MKIVVDANMFISAFIWGGIPEAVVYRVTDKSDALFLSDSIVDEIERTFRKPKLRQSESRIVAFVAYIKKIGKIVTISPKHRITGVCRDLSDEKYIECALAAGADYIISGDRDLLDLKEYGGVKIVTARDYMDIVGD